jgi:GntR family carbon starvation induced transcriptional regulator
LITFRIFDNLVKLQKSAPFTTIRTARNWADAMNLKTTSLEDIEALSPPLVPDDAGNGDTLTNSVWTRIRQDILASTLKPGAKLTIEVLKGRYEVGAGPIREALWRLSAEGLVKSNTHRGFEVTDVSRDELIDIIRLRVLLEQCALEEAIVAGDDGWEAGVLACFHRLSKFKQTDGAPWDMWHKRFHDALVATCRSPVLQRQRRQLFDLSSRYRNLVRCVSSRDDLEEHRELKEACMARDIPLAKASIARHFELTGSLVLGLFDAQRGKDAHESR